MGAIRTALALAAAVGVSLAIGCDQGGRGGGATPGPHPSTARGAASFRIVSGSENEAIEPILQRFGRDQGINLQVDYKGSVDIMLELEQGDQMPYDAIWPANSLWITLGDSQKVVKHETSVMHSPVVFGVKRSLVEKFGWLDRDVAIADVLQATEKGEFTFAMTSATQSNSGASAYFGFLHALAGGPDVLTHEHLADKQVQERTKRLLKGIDRSSGSSGWLKDLVVANPDKFQAMVNYESMIIEANRELVAQGKEPLIAIFPIDGIMIADSPLGYIDHGDSKKEQFFQALIEYLRSESVQKEIMALGRRTGLVGLDVNAVDQSVFNPAWGIDVTRVISPVPVPSEPVIREALELYQSGGLRKPSATVYVLDCSGSMQGQGIQELKGAMAMLLEPASARRFWLQPSADDFHLVIPFDGQPRQGFGVRGNDPKELQRLLGQVRGLQAKGGTNIYLAAAEALRELSQLDSLSDHFPAIILMTDGKSDGRIEVLESAIQQLKPGLEIPIYSITFGDADDRQLRQVSTLASGRVFDGQKDLAKAFRTAKGYN